MISVDKKRKPNRQKICIHLQKYLGGLQKMISVRQTLSSETLSSSGFVPTTSETHGAFPKAMRFQKRICKKLAKCGDKQVPPILALKLNFKKIKHKIIDRV